MPDNTTTDTAWSNACPAELMMSWCDIHSNDGILPAFDAPYGSSTTPIDSQLDSSLPDLLLSETAGSAKGLGVFTAQGGNISRPPKGHNAHIVHETDMVKPRVLFTAVLDQFRVIEEE